MLPGEGQGGNLCKFSETAGSCRVLFPSNINQFWLQDAVVGVKHSAADK